MGLFGNLKLAAFVGLLIGIIHGTIDIIAKFSVWSFEWFELYQTLLLSILVFVFIFIVIGIFLETAKKLFGLRFAKKVQYRFYFITSFALLILFYVATIVNRDILFRHTFFEPQSIAFNFFIFSAVGLVYIFLFFKAKGPVDRVISLFNKAKIKKIAENSVFAVFIFIMVSLAMDLYLLSSVGFGSYASSEGKPNIILISMDTVRADHLSAYGYERETSPNLDKMAEDSVVFRNAISPATWTILAHGAVFTGNYVPKFDPENTNKGLKREHRTFTEILKDRGYNTAGFVSGAWIKSKYGFGQGFNVYKDRMDFFEHKLTYDKFSMKGVIFTFIPNIEKILDTDAFIPLEEINKKALKWLDKNKDSNFFLFLHYIGAHVPYDPSSELRKKFTNDTRSYEELEAEYKKSTGLKRYGNVSKDVVDTLIDLYDAEIAELDYNLNLLFGRIEELGLKNNTIIIIMADSGEEFYEHGSFKHGRTLYQEDVHVPLLIYYPKKLEPKIVEEPVSTLDIFPTVLDMVGIGVPGDVDGVSLVPLMENNGLYEREFVKSELFGLPGYETKKQTAIFHNEWKLIEVEPETETIPSGLYNLRTDPKEKKNLYNVYPDKRKQLQKYIEDSN